MSSASDGTLYIGSMRGNVFRARPGSDKAEAWIRRTPENGILSLLGVLVDERSSTLWLCSAPGTLLIPPVTGVSALLALDLKTGASKGIYPFPDPPGVCNDITVAKDGTAYASDTPNGRIFRLRRGARSLELFSADPRLKGIDGLVVGGDGTLYVNIVTHNQLLRIDRKPDGSAGDIVELSLSQPVAGPDGFRLIAKNRVLKAGLISPPGVALVGHTAYALEGKIRYLFDPKLKGQDPGPFKAYAVPLN
jgi:hypothetical protein